ncbi:MAG: tRNA (adenosine(37)-N6)-threonylcarbamoyltransferase complex ATPase subunit type 1 TsaE [Lachnospirales bacterium]
MEIKSYSFEETYAIGLMTGKEAKVKDIFCLEGDLGVGKTVFAKGFAKGLQINEDITSPTFTIVNVYEGNLKFYHFDLYRIEDEDELFDIGFDDYLYGDGVCLVEWPKNGDSFIPKEAIKIKISKDLQKGEEYRLITIDGE